MLNAIVGHFSSIFTSVTGQSVGAVIFVWALGHYTKSDSYATVRKTIGLSVFKLFAAISKFGEMRIGSVMWNPIEKVLLDINFVVFEQAAAGLRSDNVDKLQDHLDRLTDVGSVTRSEAIAEKIDRIQNPSPVSDADVQDAAKQANLGHGAEKRN